MAYNPNKVSITRKVSPQANMIEISYSASTILTLVVTWDAVARWIQRT
jgi:hypothetical protein